jgi:hypothetical protein
VIIKNIFNNKVFTDSVDHICWYDASTIYELGKRAGLMLDVYSGIIANNTATFKSKLFRKLTPLLIKLGFNSNIFCKTIIYEFKLDK